MPYLSSYYFYCLVLIYTDPYAAGVYKNEICSHSYTYTLILLAGVDIDIFHAVYISFVSLDLIYLTNDFINKLTFGMKLFCPYVAYK